MRDYPEFILIFLSPMECLSPIKLENDTPKLLRRYNSRFRYVPCGKCPACIDKQRKHWYIRLKEEAEHSYNAQFITLTYDEASIPRNSLGYYTFCKRDIQLFMKSLRKYLDRCQIHDFHKLKLRYFIIGEYGSKFGRPHYHGLLFNIPKDVDLYRVLHQIWGRGRVSASPCTPENIGYCTNYMYGKCDALPDEFVDETNKIPLLSSRKPGIGACYVNNVIKDWHREGLKNYYQESELKYPLPRFWADKIFDDDDKVKLHYLLEKRIEEQIQKDIIYLHEYYQKYGILTSPPDEQRRREFVRKFNSRKKKHFDEHRHNHHGDKTIGDTNKTL